MYVQCTYMNTPVACCSYYVFVSYDFFSSRSNYPFNSFKHSPVVLSAYLYYGYIIELSIVAKKLPSHYVCYDVVIFFYAVGLSTLG